MLSRPLRHAVFVSADYVVFSANLRARRPNAGRLFIIKRRVNVGVRCYTRKKQKNTEQTQTGAPQQYIRLVHANLDRVVSDL